MEKGTAFECQVTPRIPPRLQRLYELADNLWYSWERPARDLFSRLQPKLWESVGHNPKAFLKRIDESRLEEAAKDYVFLGNYNRVLSSFDTYMNESLGRDEGLGFKDGDLIAYFCAEFGFHESFPIYSGGLGILAGDHCKTASDLRLPFVAVGLLYRQGYFSQHIDSDGGQVATYNDSNFDDLPVSPALNHEGNEVHVRIEFPGRMVEAKVWMARIGHITLYLLDTNLSVNTEADRNITHQLYGGDKHTRIQQEIVLGIGGMRALSELGIKPSVFHINEGHAAFLVLERVRQLVKQGLPYEAALEAVAVNTVFTTHTPVPAGHDHFPAAMIWDYFAHCCTDMGVPREVFMRMGGGEHDFNMTRLALIGSRHHNGVSRIHGGVSSQILSDMWPQIAPEESPMDYITNGIHVPTFLAQDWQDLFDSRLGYEWRRRVTDVDYWRHLEALPDHQFWTVHQTQKALLLDYVNRVLTQQHMRNQGSPAHLDRILKLADPLNPNVLVIGFARRFATYKRATLLFENIDWLRTLLNDADRPVLFLFAGKAHPADQPGQELIRRIYQISCQPEFEGKILLLEGYDMSLSRRLVAGCDVWLNNPIYPLEASGTSGMKAAMNGVLNLSVTDGWWDEGYDGTNGWAIKPAPAWYDDARRDREDSRSLYELLQDKVIPLYYQKNELGYSPGWVRMAKRSIATLLPTFSSSRMVSEYVHKFYVPASEVGRRMHENDYAGARELAHWKQRVRSGWGGVSVRLLTEMPRQMVFGDEVTVRVAVNLDGLSPEDMRVDLLQSRGLDGREVHHEISLTHVGNEGHEAIFAVVHKPDWCGRMRFRVRAYPYHPLLTHRFETGLLLWL